MKIEAVNTKYATNSIKNNSNNISNVSSATNTSSNSAPQNEQLKEAVEEVKLSLNEIERSTLPISEKIVIEAIEKANKAINGARTEFKFSIHEETRQILVKVLDKDSGEIIKEIPNEKILDMVACMWEMAGIIVDEKR